MEADAPAEASGQQEQEVENKTQGQPRSVALFFGNLPWNATSEDVKAAVKEKCGLEVEAKISKKKSGLSRGWGTVRSNPEHVEKLIGMSEKVVISDRHIRIERRRPRKRKKKRETGDTADAKPREPTREDETENKNDQQTKGGVLLYLNNVPWEVDIDRLKSALKEIIPDLECDDVRVSKRGSGLSRGYATVRVTKEQAEILKTHSRKMEIGGRQIVIEPKKRPTRRSKRQAKAEAEAAAAKNGGEGEAAPADAQATANATGTPAQPAAQAAPAAASDAKQAQEPTE